MMNQAKYPEYQVGRVDIAVEQCVSLIFDISIIVLLIFQIIKSHHGDCRGAVVSKIQSSDGNCVTREAKLSIHETPHEHHYELEKLNQ